MPSKLPEDPEARMRIARALVALSKLPKKQRKPALEAERARRAAKNETDAPAPPLSTPSPKAVKIAAGLLLRRHLREKQQPESE